MWGFFTRLVRRYFGFSRRETYGVTLLLFLLPLLLVAKWFFRELGSYSQSALFLREKKELHKLLLLHKKKIILDLNEATTDQLSAIQGLSIKDAKQVINYKNRLGGYIKKEQLSEIKALPQLLLSSEPICFFVKKKFIPQKLMVNGCKVSVLAAHPYITDRQAVALVTCRQEWGDLDEAFFSQLHFFSKKEKERILPYLDFAPSN